MTTAYQTSVAADEPETLAKLAAFAKARYGSTDCAGLQWLARQTDTASAWNECTRGDWMSSAIAAAPAPKYDTPAHRKLVRVAAAIADSVEHDVFRGEDEESGNIEPARQLLDLMYTYGDGIQVGLIGPGDFMDLSLKIALVRYADYALCGAAKIAAATAFSSSLRHQVHLCTVVTHVLESHESAAIVRGSAEVERVRTSWLGRIADLIRVEYPTAPAL